MHLRANLTQFKRQLTPSYCCFTVVLMHQRQHDHNTVIKHLFIILISHCLKPFFPTVNVVSLIFSCFNSLSRFWPFAKAKQCVPQKVTSIKMKWGTMFLLCEAKKQSFKRRMYCRIFWAFLTLKISCFPLSVEQIAAHLYIVCLKTLKFPSCSICVWNHDWHP